MTLLSMHPTLPTFTLENRKKGSYQYHPLALFLAGMTFPSHLHLLLELLGS